MKKKNEKNVPKVIFVILRELSKLQVQGIKGTASFSNSMTYLPQSYHAYFKSGVFAEANQLRGLAIK